MKKIHKIGVFGAGHLGKIHIKLILELQENFNLIGFFDPNDENANYIEDFYKLKRFETYEELINQVDCIDIVTPTISHFEIASLAITQNKHVFIEKPITQTVEEAENLINLVNQFHVLVQVGHVERFNPAFQEAIQFLKEPMFIETHRLAQFNPRGTDVPVVLDLMIHDIDIILSIVKSNVKTISASGVAVISESDDITNARIEFENGCVANLTSSRISLKNMRKSRFFQKDAYISIDFLLKELEVVRMENIDEVIDPYDIVLDTGDGKTKKKVLFDKPDITATNAIKEELISFSKVILTNSKPVVDIHDGYQALKVASLILNEVKKSKMIL
jgi:predicted dehydrogenase